MCYLCHSVIAAPWLSKLCDIVHWRPWKPGNLSSKTPITEYFLSVQQKFFFTHIFSLKYHKKPELLSLSEKKKKDFWAMQVTELKPLSHIYSK